MEMGGYGFEKPELLVIAEQIYADKQKKQEIELQLSSERFHYAYIPKRRGLVIHEVLFRLLFIVPMTAYLINILLFSDNLFGGLNGIDGVSLLFSVLTFAAVGYMDVKLIIREFKMVRLLYVSMNSERALRYAKKHDLNTFQSDEAKSKERIRLLESEIASLDAHISELEEQERGLKEEQEQREDVLRKKGILFDENPNKPKKQGKFALKEESTGTMDILQMHEYYLKEEQYINNYLLQLDGRLRHIDKEITDIEDDFERVKKKVFFSILAFIFIVVVQQAFTGVLLTATNIVCFIGGLMFLVYLDRSCSRPVILYLVEHDSSLTREYAFCNDMIPVKRKRDELLEIIEHNRRELEEIKRKKKTLIS